VETGISLATLAGSPNAQYSDAVAAVPPPGGFENIHNVQQVVIPDPPGDISSRCAEGVYK
jgi:hypothetical protein